MLRGAATEGKGVAQPTMAASGISRSILRDFDGEFLYETDHWHNAVRQNGGAGERLMSCMHIYVWDRMILSAGPGREDARHRHFGAIVIIAPDAPMTLTTDGVTRISAQAALIAPNAWHQADCRDSRTVTILIGPDHPWFCYVKPALTGAPITPLDLSLFTASALPWDALFAGDSDCVKLREYVQQILQAIGGPQPAPHRLDERIVEVLHLLRENVVHPPKADDLGRRVGLSGFTLMRR